MTNKHRAIIYFEFESVLKRDDDQLIHNMNVFFETEVLVNKWNNSIVINSVDPTQLTLFVMSYDVSAHGWCIVKTELIKDDQENH